MTLWIIEPRDPLIVRDGRPFGPDPGARARSMDFPLPSVVAGGIRTLAGQKDGKFEASISDVKGVEVRGPVLVKLNDAGGISDFLVTAPQDALVVKAEGANDPQIKQLVPRKLPDGVKSNLNHPSIADNVAAPSLQHVSFAGTMSRDKPYRDAPRYWSWKKYSEWLVTPQDQIMANVNEWGIKGVTKEYRMHVGIDKESQSADTENGALFQTSSLEFTLAGRLGVDNRLAMAVAVQPNPNAPTLLPTAGLAPLGGERRIMRWSQAMGTHATLPTCPSDKQGVDIVAHVKNRKCCRLLLVTPAYFTQGYYPEWLIADSKRRYSVDITLKAISTPRPVTASGWNFETNKPKASRRLAAAGSVYWVGVNGTDTAIEAWATAMWFSCISDEEQSRRDGFGMVTVGVW